MYLASVRKLPCAAVLVLTLYPVIPTLRNAERMAAMEIINAALGRGDLAARGRQQPRVSVRPAGAQTRISIPAPTVIVSGHFQRVLAERARHNNVVNGPSVSTVVERPIASSRFDIPAKRPSYSDWIVIIDLLGKRSWSQSKHKK